MSVTDSQILTTSLLADRFRTYLPVVVDLETGGFNSKTDAILEAAAVVVATVSYTHLTLPTICSV